MIIEKVDHEKFKPFVELFAELKRELGNVSYKYWIAGGALTSHVSGIQINDYDLYSNNPTELIRDITLISGTPIQINEFSFEFDFNGKLLQITNYPYRDPIHTLQNFDFNICCVSFDGANIYRSEDFWNDIHNKEIRFRKNNRHSFHAYLRMIKYSKRGFSPTHETILRVGKDLCSGNYDWDKITTQHLKDY